MLKLKRESFLMKESKESITYEDLGLYPEPEYAVLYIDGDDVDGAIETTRPWKDLSVLMKDLSDEVLKTIRGEEHNTTHEVWVEFLDRHANLIEKCMLPVIETDSRGHLLVHSVRERPSMKDLKSLCSLAFNKLCYLPS